MWSAFLRTREYMQPAEDYFASALSIPVSQFVSTSRERQMHSNADSLRQRFIRRPAMQQIFIPIPPPPVSRSGCREAAERQCWSQYMLTEASVRILGIKRIDEQGVSRFDWSRW